MKKQQAGQTDSGGLVRWRSFTPAHNKYIRVHVWQRDAAWLPCFALVRLYDTYVHARWCCNQAGFSTHSLSLWAGSNITPLHLHETNHPSVTMPMLGLYFGSVTIDLKRSQRWGSRPETSVFLQTTGKISRCKKQRNTSKDRGFLSSAAERQGAAVLYRLIETYAHASFQCENIVLKCHFIFVTFISCSALCKSALRLFSYMFISFLSTTLYSKCHAYTIFSACMFYCIVCVKHKTTDFFFFFFFTISRLLLFYLSWPF